MSSREQILGRLKNANWASGYIPPAVFNPSPPQAGELDLFTAKAQAAGALVHRVPDLDSARDWLAGYIKENNIRRVVGARDRATVGMVLTKLAEQKGFDFKYASDTSNDGYRSYVLGAELGVSGCSYGVAETGTLVITHGHNNERLVSHAPDHYIGVIYPDQILTDRFCLASILQAEPAPPAAWTLITGVSRTADVALQVVLGMHGPRKVSIIIIG